MSGIDEQAALVSICPICKSQLLTWYINGSRDRKFEVFNCTDEYGGPDHTYHGDMKDIEFFQCGWCDGNVRRGTLEFNVIMSLLKISPHVDDNVGRKLSRIKW